MPVVLLDDFISGYLPQKRYLISQAMVINVLLGFGIGYVFRSDICQMEIASAVHFVNGLYGLFWIFTLDGLSDKKEIHDVAIIEMALIKSRCLKIDWRCTRPTHKTLSMTTKCFFKSSLDRNRTETYHIYTINYLLTILAITFGQYRSV